MCSCGGLLQGRAEKQRLQGARLLFLGVCLGLPIRSVRSAGGRGGGARFVAAERPPTKAPVRIPPASWCCACLFSDQYAVETCARPAPTVGLPLRSPFDWVRKCGNTPRSRLCGLCQVTLRPDLEPLPVLNQSSLNSCDYYFFALRPQTPKLVSPVVPLYLPLNLPCAFVRPSRVLCLLPYACPVVVRYDVNESSCVVSGASSPSSHPTRT